MDPHTDEVVGIKIRVAQWLEHSMNDIPSAITVMDIVFQELLDWLDMAEKNPYELPWAYSPGRIIGEGEAARVATQEDFDAWFWPLRTSVLMNAVKISVKMGQLNLHDQAMDRDKSHELVLWGLEAALKEARRRKVEGVREGEGEWLSEDAFGAQMEGE